MPDQSNTALLERPQLIRPEEDLVAKLRGAAKEKKETTREPISDETLSQMTSINKADAKTLLLARKFENEIVRSFTMGSKEIANKKTDPGGEVLNIKPVRTEKQPTTGIMRAFFEIDRKWEQYGWNTEVANKIIAETTQNLLFPDGIKLSEERQKTLMELLIASGQSGNAILSMLNRSTLEATLQDNETKHGARDRRFGYIDFFQTLGIREDYVRHFLLPELFKDYNDRDMQNEPGSVEELAWQMGEKNSVDFGLHGRFPLLETRIIIENGKINAEKSQLHLNKGNLRRWVRERAYDLFDKDPFGTPNYFQEVKLDKGPLATIVLEAFFHRKSEFLTSENKWLDMADELERDLQLDVWTLGFARRAWVTYQQEQGDEGKWPELMKAIHQTNLVTRRT
ncbi:MAG TPA: hypothetical protein VE090_00345, partial [Methylomirabilota bacterium]|nr:hypothetical protein [Methylomirabilota bacterium]